ncbi:hypothetical protein V9T40_007498 [Parthenolecanium corni]|uniref:Uncharacterized protein n=1 Tax=Parthenolecanium corni TaxID=536013 RepID=A0AAN9TH60_9HEMI
MSRSLVPRLRRIASDPIPSHPVPSHPISSHPALTGPAAFKYFNLLFGERSTAYLPVTTFFARPFHSPLALTISSYRFSHFSILSYHSSRCSSPAPPARPDSPHPSPKAQPRANYEYKRTRTYSYMCIIYLLVILVILVISSTNLNRAYRRISRSAVAAATKTTPAASQRSPKIY